MKEQKNNYSHMLSANQNIDKLEYPLKNVTTFIKKKKIKKNERTRSKFRYTNIQKIGLKITEKRKENLRETN